MRDTVRMPLDRRSLIAATGAVALAFPARAAPLSQHGLNGAHFGLQPGAPADQSVRFQRAIDEASRARVPLALAPGVYRAGDLNLPTGAQILGVRGATRIVLTHGQSLIASAGGDAITLSGLTLDGQQGEATRGLVRLSNAKDLRIVDCTIANATADAISLEACAGAIENNTIDTAGDNALFALDSRGLIVRGNLIRRCGNGGIRIWQSDKRRDGSLVLGNTIEEISARAGGDGQNGNGINIFRAAGVIVRDNAVSGCAFSAVRGNAASELQIVGNRCRDIGEVALYAEFDFEGAVIAANIVDGAALGIAVTNFNSGGRLATVQGNVIRNLKSKRPQGGSDSAGTGISVEADTAVTGNVIEKAPWMGIEVGAGRFLRDVTVTGNVIRQTGYGIGVSVVSGAGATAITGNLISGARLGALAGIEWGKVMSTDLARDAGRYPNLTVANNKSS
jgi:uncharacterized secreted repeat protein (TIGR03808 family)